MMRTKSWSKMHDRMRWCTMKREDAWAWECIARVQESVLSLARYCREAAHNMWNHSTHDGDVVLWSPVIMSRKIGQYQPVENWVSTAPALFTGKDNMWLAALNTATKRLCAQVSKYYRVNGTNPCASEDRLSCHWQIYWNGIALVNTKSFEDICNGADLVE